jgi:hypothetical protein
MPSPGWQATAEALVAILETLPDVRKVLDHEPRQVGANMVPFATVWGPSSVDRPGAQLPQTELGRFDSTAEWTVRIYTKLQREPKFAQRQIRDQLDALINAFDLYRNGTPAGQPWADDAAITRAVPALLEPDRKILILEATVESFHTA